MLILALIGLHQLNGKGREVFCIFWAEMGIFVKLGKLQNVHYIFSYILLPKLQKNKAVCRKPLTLYRLHNTLPLQSSCFALWWWSVAFVSQLLFSRLSPIAWNPLWRKDVLKIIQNCNKGVPEGRKGWFLGTVAEQHIAMQKVLFIAGVGTTALPFNPAQILSENKILIKVRPVPFFCPIPGLLIFGD